MNRQCFHLLQSQPSPTHADHYRVCVVTEDELGYQPTGGGDVEPWFWDHATCIAMNEKRFGVSTEEAEKIVVSSMFSAPDHRTYTDAMKEQYQPRICINEDGDEYLDF